MQDRRDFIETLFKFIGITGLGAMAIAGVPKKQPKKQTKNEAAIDELPFGSLPTDRYISAPVGSFTFTHIDIPRFRDGID